MTEHGFILFHSRINFMIKSPLVLVAGDGKLYSHQKVSEMRVRVGMNAFKMDSMVPYFSAMFRCFITSLGVCEA